MWCQSWAQEMPKCGEHGLARTPTKTKKRWKSVRMQVLSVLRSAGKIGWSQWVRGRSCRSIRMDWSIWRSKSRPNCCNLRPFGDSFTPSWAQRKHNMGNEASSIAKHIKQRGKTILRIRLAMSPVLSSTWAKLVPKWVRFRAMLEASWAEIGTRRVQVGNLGPCWPKLLMLRPCRIETVHLANVGPMLGRSQNVQILPQSLRRIHCYTTTPGHLQCRWTCWLFMHDGIRHAISVHAYIDR